MSPFDPEDYWRISLKLVSQKPSEADFRTAANRAYYACHLIGCNKGLFERSYSAGDHSNLWRELHRRNMAWANKLQSLYTIREHVDYHTDPKVPQNAMCPYCNDTPENVWMYAKAISEDILPRIKSLAQK